jgi:hypothetical protein
MQTRGGLELIVMYMPRVMMFGLPSASTQVTMTMGETGPA